MTTDDSTRLLHTWTGELSVLGTRSLIQACLYSADLVLLPASVTVQEGLGDDERSFVQAQVGRLVELGAVATWGVDGIDRSPMVSSAPMEVIARERYREIYDRSIDLLMDRRSVFMGGDRATRFDGVTEVVVGKHAVMHALLAEELSASAILHDQDSADGYARFLTDLLNPAGLIAQIATSVAVELDLPEASALPDAMYENARRKLGRFRSYILQRLRTSGPILLGDAAIEELRVALVRDVVQEYLEYAEATRNQKITGRPWLRNLWQLKRLGHLAGGAKGNDPLQILYDLKSAGKTARR